MSVNSLVNHSRKCLSAYDWGCFGLRSTEDINRVKKSFVHHYDFEAGWEATEFLGGRAKLCGVKKGQRPWRVWTVCFCPGAQHQRPPQIFYLKIKADGNPRLKDGEKVPWCTTCPLACLEFIWTLQPTTRKRRYPKWLDSGRFGDSNVGDVASEAIQFFIDQGAIKSEQRFDRNAGRKSLEMCVLKQRLGKVKKIEPVFPYCAPYPRET